MLSLLAAWRFLTIIPVPFHREDWNKPLSQEQFTKSLVYYPLIGLIIGLILCAAYWLFSAIMPEIMIPGFILGLAIYLTGGLHLDGLIDTFDGLAGGHRSAERRKQIMKEPGVGAVGVVAFGVIILLKYAALAGIGESSIYQALIIMPVFSRWAMVVAVIGYPYAREQGMGKLLQQGGGSGILMLATLITLGIGLIVGGWQSLIILAAVVGVVIVIARTMQRKIGGLTGDSYGTINEISEVAVLTLFAILLFINWI
jgi:adenosylcobinamide-GDP ribazoletransferase